MNVHEAIKLAIDKGGYDSEKIADPWIIELYTSDPLFWQALGKALGWETYYSKYKFTGAAQNERGEWQANEWLENWHLYIDALADGTEEEFWKSLTKTQ